jgi:hypothetical protein
MLAGHFRVLGVLFVVFLAACATPVSTNIKPSTAGVAKYSNLSDLNVVATLEKNLNEARAANMPFLAPHYFQEAAQVLSECQNQLGSKPRDELVNSAARGDAILEKGRAVMEIVKYRFSRELDLKEQLDRHDAARLLPGDYESTIGGLSALIEKVEREQAVNIDRDKERLQKSMQDLLVRAVQEGALRESEAVNADSKARNAEKQAPATYAEALKTYQDAKEQIAANHEDEKLVQRLGAQALFAAHHAQQINERVAQLQNQLNVIMSNGVALSGTAGTGGVQAGMQSGGQASGAERLSLEKIALLEENRLQEIATALGLDDLRDRPLDKQAEDIRRAAAEKAHPANDNKVVQDYETRLKAADDATRQATAQLAAKDQQIADRDARIKTLNEKVAQLEGTKKPEAAKRGAAKPKARKAKRSSKQ